MFLFVSCIQCLKSVTRERKSYPTTKKLQRLTAGPRQFGRPRLFPHNPRLQFIHSTLLQLLTHLQLQLSDIDPRK
jgi:hypothetical protein